MRRLQTFQDSAKALLLTCTTLLIGASEDRFKDALKGVLKASGSVDVIKTAAIGLVLLLALRSSTAFLEWLVESSRLVRRIVMGRADVEGVWVDVSFPLDRAEWQGGILTIGYAGGKLTVQGDTFDAVGARVGSFSSGISDYTDGVLRYWFDKVKQTTDNLELNGASVYRFDLLNRPCRFDGRYFSSTGQVVQLHGERLDRKTARSLKTLEDKGRHARTFIAAYRANASSG
jgi:hypothetical protein